MKAFYRHKIPGSSCTRKETVDIDILVTSKNDDRKIVQSIRITSSPLLRKRKWNQLCQFWRTFEEQSNTYRKDLSWLHLSDEPRVQEKAAGEGYSFCIFDFVACPTIPRSDMWMNECDNSFMCGRFIKIKSNLRRNKLHRTN